jgi:hypothetical protein
MIDRAKLIQNFKVKASHLRHKIDTIDNEEERTENIKRYCQLVYFLLSL